MEGLQLFQNMQLKLRCYHPIEPCQLPPFGDLYLD
jgi:hypothetical protein